MIVQDFVNLAQMIDLVGAFYQNPDAFNKKQDGKWLSISTKQFVERIRKLALALQQIGLEKGDGFSVIAYPDPLWLIIDFASIAAGGISVPIFPNIATNNLEFEVSDANVQMVFCNDEQVFKMLQKCPHKFKKIIIDNFEKPVNAADNIIELSELLAIGTEIYGKKPYLYQELIAGIKAEDLLTIIYTSGSTGKPKGVRLTHQNLVLQIKAIDDRFPLNPLEDVALSFLPLAHIFERLVSAYYIFCGVSIYFVDDVKNIGEVIKELNPTIMTVVPRLLEKVYGKMKYRLENQSFLKRIIGEFAFKYALTKEPDYKENFIQKVFDFLVYRKLRNALGGQFKFMICGSAPLSESLERFFKNIGINLYVGYGLTETTAVVSCNYPRFNKPYTVGKPFPGMEVKLAKDKELLAKSGVIMSGYHNREDMTIQAIDDQGWFKTGDLATIDEEGYIKITGRKKELFKTSTGKYISPVPIEQKLVRQCDFLAAASIIAEGRKFVSCLLFVDFEVLKQLKNKAKMAKLSDKQFLKSNFIKEKINKIINEVNSGLNHYEQIKKYYLSDDRISIESGELTPSMKLRRSFVEKKYQQQIEQFYQD